MKPLVICVKYSRAIHEEASLKSPLQSDWPQALSLFHSPSHTLSLAPAVFLQRGNYCMALSDLNEADMKGLTEMKPGSKMLIHAHSYSLAAAHCHTQAHIWTSKHTHTHLFSHTHTRILTHTHTRGVENSLGDSYLRRCTESHAAVTFYK